jgi:hypothetical protein
MSILAQCGYGRGDKAQHAILEGIIDGVVLSPRDESRSRLENDISHWRKASPQSIVLFDPQFYVATLNDPRDGHLGEYEYYSNNNNLGRTQFAGSLVNKYVKSCLGYQHRTLGNKLSYLISPSVLIDDFRDYWSQIAIDMGVESMRYCAGLTKPKPLLVTLLVSETAFLSESALDDYLDVLTELEVDGFYIIINRTPGVLKASIESRSFSRIMYLCHVLATINKYTLIVGYSDWYGFLLESVGVRHTACGWYHNLKQFNIQRFLPSSGGRQPKRRYSSLPMLSSPLIATELQDIYLAGKLSDVLSDTPYDSIISNGPAGRESSWTGEIACLEHWATLAKLSKRIAAKSRVKDKIEEAKLSIVNAQALYNELALSNVTFESSTGAGPRHLEEWLRAIEEFQSMI